MGHTAQHEKSYHKIRPSRPLALLRLLENPPDQQLLQHQQVPFAYLCQRQIQPVFAQCLQMNLKILFLHLQLCVIQAQAAGRCYYQHLLLLHLTKRLIQLQFQHQHQGRTDDLVCQQK